MNDVLVKQALAKRNKPMYAPFDMSGLGNTNRQNNTNNTKNNGMSQIAKGQSLNPTILKSRG